MNLTEDSSSCYRNNLGRAMKGVLAQAKVERRLICGLIPAIDFLGKFADDALLCILPTTNAGDATSHMQTVLLQAYCFENFIPVIHVDNGDKLAEFCGVQKSRPNEYMCVIVSRDMSMTISDDEDLPLSPNEQKLTEFYECTLEENPRPVVILPR